MSAVGRLEPDRRPPLSRVLLPLPPESQPLGRFEGPRYPSCSGRAQSPTAANVDGIQGATGDYTPRQCCAGIARLFDVAVCALQLGLRRAQPRSLSTCAPARGVSDATAAFARTVRHSAGVLDPAMLSSDHSLAPCCAAVTRHRAETHLDLPVRAARDSGHRLAHKGKNTCADLACGG